MPDDISGDIADDIVAASNDDVAGNGSATVIAMTGIGGTMLFSFAN